MSNLSNNSGNNKREFWRWPLYILIAVGVLASLAVAGERLAAEAGSVRLHSMASARISA